VSLAGPVVLAVHEEEQAAAAGQPSVAAARLPGPVVLAVLG
jgi:hypothetical protein